LSIWIFERVILVFYARSRLRCPDFLYKMRNAFLGSYWEQPEEFSTTSEELVSPKAGIASHQHLATQFALQREQNGTAAIPGGDFSGPDQVEPTVCHHSTLSRAWRWMES
jgi:hypothetical protein